MSAREPSRSRIFIAARPGFFKVEPGFRIPFHTVEKERVTMRRGSGAGRHTVAGEEGHCAVIIVVVTFHGIAAGIGESESVPLIVGVEIIILARAAHSK